MRKRSCLTGKNVLLVIAPPIKPPMAAITDDKNAQDENNYTKG